MRTKMTHLKKSFAKKSAPKKALAKKTPMKRPCCNKKSMKRSCWITAERVDKTSVTLSGEVELSEGAWILSEQIFDVNNERTEALL